MVRATEVSWAALSVSGILCLTGWLSYADGEGGRLAGYDIEREKAPETGPSFFLETGCLLVLKRKKKRVEGIEPS